MTDKSPKRGAGRRGNQRSLRQRWKAMTIANKLLIGVGAVTALAGVIYALAFVYQVWRQEQRANEASRTILGAKIHTNEVTDRKIVFTVAVHNGGSQRTLATLKYCILPDLKPNLLHSLQDCVEGATTQGPFAVLPNDNWPAMIRVDDPARIPLVRARQLYFYFCGTISYSDAGEEKTIPLCAVYDEDFERMGDCMSVQGKQNKPTN